MGKQNLVPIRVKITYGMKEGAMRHIYPNFNILPSNVRGNMDWSHFFDAHGIGWHYDRLSGIGEADVYNPDPDMWYGCTCVPEDFALAAVAAFPSTVEVIDEATFETFYNDRAHVKEPAEMMDADILAGIEARRKLGLPDTEYINKALDPNDPTPGIRANKKRYWVDFKQQGAVTIDAKQAKTI